jgi:hypothetical protein
MHKNRFWVGRLSFCIIVNSRLRIIANYIDLAEVQPLNPNKYACNWIRGYLQQYQHQTDSKLGCHQIKLLVN